MRRASNLEQQRRQRGGEQVPSCHGPSEAISPSPRITRPCPFARACPTGKAARHASRPAAARAVPLTNPTLTGDCTAHAGHRPHTRTVHACTRGAQRIHECPCSCYNRTALPPTPLLHPFGQPHREHAMPSLRHSRSFPCGHPCIPTLRYTYSNSLRYACSQGTVGTCQHEHQHPQPWNSTPPPQRHPPRPRGPRPMRPTMEPQSTSLTPMTTATAGRTRSPDHPDLPDSPDLPCGTAHRVRLPSAVHHPTGFILRATYSDISFTRTATVITSKGSSTR